MSDPRPAHQEEQVRRLLADARLDEPMPDDVADRLDRVLADLRPAGSDPASSDPASSVRDLRAARRRRTRRGLALAAAAAVVVGVGITRVDLSNDPSGSDTSADTSAASERRPSADAGGSAADRRSLRRDPADQPAGRPQDSTPEGYRAGAAWTAPVPVTAGSFERVARRLADPRRLGAVNLYYGDAGPTADRDDLRMSAKAAAGCADPAWGRGRRVAARYDGDPAVIVLRPVRDGERVVDLYLCGASVPWRTTTVPTR